MTPPRCQISFFDNFFTQDAVKNKIGRALLKKPIITGNRKFKKPALQ